MRVKPKIEVNNEIKVDFLPILVLDSSGSMSGSKYNNAVLGLKKLTEEFNEGIFIEFSSEIKVSKFSKGVLKNTFMGNGTRLNDVIGEIKKQVDLSNKKCLINVFTDGQEYHSYEVNTNQAKNIIQDLVKNNHTFSFQCTKKDFNTIKNTYCVPESNILTYENNADGVEYAFKMSMDATRVYKSALAKGEDVTLGFYSKVLIK